MRNFLGQRCPIKQWQKFCTETLKKVFSNKKKIASRNIFRHFFRANFFMFVLLISNHTVFLVQFEINLHLRVFQKAEIALAMDEDVLQVSTSLFALFSGGSGYTPSFSLYWRLTVV